MMFSATESTSSFICSLVLTLANQFPAMLENVQHHEQLVPIANEVLRIYTPVPYIYRTVRKQTLYAGVPLNVGDTVIVFIGSANLDPTHFDEPRLVKLDRKEKHLSFGKGPYACIGQTYSMRLALNVIHCLAESQYKLMPVNGEESSQIYNGMIRVPMHFVLKNKSDVRK
jgi:cytochrome P450